ncbi:MAG: diacylglycerol kinase family protein [Planctomycetota bacterium]|nr:diacylglycerol kinase family protein [Planctomycetota bacterium]
MYFYIYDSFLSEKKYSRTLAAIETRLTDLGISGKIGRLSPFTSAKGLIRDEVRRGTKTVVVVGNDETVSKAVEGIGDVDVTLGLIPIGAPIDIAGALGIPSGAEACDVLSKRLMQKIDMGRVNGRFFLSSVRIPSGRVVIEGDGQYRIVMPTADCEIVVSNLRSGVMPQSDVEVANIPGDPMDGLLDALIVPQVGGVFGLAKRGTSPSIIPMRRMSIRSEESIDMYADGQVFSAKDFLIEVVPDCLKVITGRGRVFAQV